MKVAKIKFVPWDKSYFFSLNEVDVSQGDLVIVDTDMGTELGTVHGIEDIDEKEFLRNIDRDGERSSGIKPIIRIANDKDREQIQPKREKLDALDYARILKDRHNLDMKFVDVHFSYDGSRITFAFIADGRIDFRNMVKDMTRHFGKTIRLQQIGIRDEAKVCGDCGHCGRTLCCKGHLRELASITSEMSELQQCSHRGSDRVSGVCGRLMCCLAYEQSGYEELAKKMPPIGTKVDVDGEKGEIIGQHILKQSVRVKFNREKEGGSTIAEVDLNRNKE